jgi:scyllo-inositol 2-dehydrogenase (NADP+)
MRYVVVGLGNIGSKRKVALGARCVATVDPLNQAADFRSLEDCPSDRYDAAVLAVPNPIKLDLVRFLVDRGKHALVEKPFILDASTATELSARAEAGGAIWYTSYNFRFEPNVVAMKRLLDAAELGQVYFVRMFYGNGTARDHLGSWRDSRFGVLEDMSSHLVDLAGFVFGKLGSRFLVWERRGHELRGVDHAILATLDRTVVIETSFLSYKNRWQIEVVGEKGALLMNGLTKWGESELIVWQRTLPSGPPVERREIAKGPDGTWKSDIEHFEKRVSEGRGSCANDLWISQTIAAAAAEPLAGQA